jgi:hypothetical protein
MNFGSSLVIGPFQVIVYVSDSFQAMFDVIDWAGVDQ